MCGQTTMRVFAGRGAAFKMTVATIALTCGLMAGPVWAEDHKIRFDIESQALAEALNRFALWSDLEIFFAPELVDGKSSVALKGRYSPTEALDRLLRGTGLTFELERGDLLIVRQIRSTAQGRSGDRSSNHGNGSQRQLAQLEETERASNVEKQAGPAQRLADELDEEGEIELEEMVVTGSQIHGVHPAGAEVFTIDRQEIELTGLATIEDVLRTLPQNFGGGPNDVTANAPVPRNLSNRNAGLGTGVNLRGLGVAATLTLMNGRRTAGDFNANFTDISLIPLVAVERVEVLTDGASAIYGGDAVGGVVNVILRTDYEGAETRVRLGTVTDGGQQEYQVSQAFGTSWDGGNIVFAYEHYRRGALFASERDFAASSDLTPFGGDDFRTNSCNPGTIVAGGQTFAIPEGQDGTALTPGDLVAGTENLCTDREGSTLLPRRARHSLFATITQDVADWLEVFAEGRYTHREFEQLTAAQTQVLTVTSDNPFFVDVNGDGSPIQVRYSFIDDLGPTAFEGKVDAYSLVAGTTVSMPKEWRAEVYGSYSRELPGGRTNRVNTAFLGDFLTDPSPAIAFSPFGDGSNTNPMTVEAITGFFGGGGGFGDLAGQFSDLWLVNAKADGALFRLPGGDVKLGFGVEYREEVRDGQVVSFFNTRDVSTTPQLRLEREVLAAFGELFIPIIGPNNEIPGFENVEVSAAVRFEDYSDFGSTTNPKIGVAWSPIGGVTIRGTYGTSFKPPNLVDLDTTNNSFFGFPTPDPSSPTGSSDTILLLGNNPDTGPEEATTWTVGIDLAPEIVPGFNAQFTYFDIEFRDRIASAFSSFATVLIDEEVFESIIDRNPDSGIVQSIFDEPRFFDFVGFTDPSDVDAVIDLRLTNLAVTVVRGLDFEASYGIDTDIGAFNLSLNASYFLDFEEGFTANSPRLETIDTVGKPVDWSLRGGVSWNYGGFSANTFVNYIDNYMDDISDPNRNVKSYTTVDLRMAYDTHDQFSSHWLNDIVFSVFVRNLFDEDPPFFNNGLAGITGIGFDAEKANPQGRFVAIQVTKQW